MTEQQASDTCFDAAALQPGERPEGIPKWLVRVIALGCGLMAANIYYAQPLVELISASLGLPREASGLVVTCSQIGYGVGLAFVVPLGDLIENRRLVIATSSIAIVALVVAALAPNAAIYLIAAVFIGLGSVTVQILVPYAAHLSPESTRGHVVGSVTSGLMLGIMMARPLASFIADLLSWHAVFLASAAAVLALVILMRAALPPRQPEHELSYGQLMKSMITLVRTSDILRRRAIYQGCLFGSFTAFWTTVPMHLTQQFHFSQTQIGLFALVGVSGVFTAPIAGRLADRGLTRPATNAAFATAMVAFLLCLIAQHGSVFALGLLVAAAIALDAGTAGNLVLGQRAIYALDPAHRSRLNGIYIAILFVGGALASALSVWIYAALGWSAACLFSLSLPLCAFAYHLTERDTGTPSKAAA